MKQLTKTSVSLALSGVLMASALGGAFTTPAQARKGSNTWKTGAIAGAVIGGYGLLKHNRTATIAGLGATGYSLYRYNKARKNEKRQQRYGYLNRRRYGYNYRSRRAR